MQDEDGGGEDKTAKGEGKPKPNNVVPMRGLPPRKKPPEKLSGLKRREDCRTLLQVVRWQQENGPRFEWPIKSPRIGTAKLHVENISEFLAWCSVKITFDEFAHRVRFDGLPGHSEHTDAAVQDIGTVLQWLGMPKFDLDYLHSVLPVLARENRVHPVREYLEGLKWDGVERLNTWLTYYLGVENTPLSARIGRVTLLGAVWRVMVPGSKYDYMTILEGQQDAGKSSAWLALVPQSEWFHDDVTLGGRKRESLEELTGFWIIESAELVGLSAKDLESIKSFLSRRFDVGRWVWGRKVERVPRQTVFVGSTNLTEYLRDPTGARRFLPVYCRCGPGEIDFEGLAQIRDQLWAEAMLAYKNGEKPVMPKELLEASRIEQEQRRVGDPHGDRLEELLADAPEGFIPSEELWKAVGKAKGAREQRMKSMIQDVMRRCGWDLLPSPVRIGLPAVVQDRRPNVPSRVRQRRGWAKGADYLSRVYFYNADEEGFVEHDKDGRPVTRYVTGADQELTPEEAEALFRGAADEAAADPE